MHKFSKDVTLDDKFARAVTIEPPWERVTIFNWNDLRGMYDRIAELERELDEARKGMHTTEEVEKAVRKVASIWRGGETDTFMKRVMTALTAPPKPKERVTVIDQFGYSAVLLDGRSQATWTMDNVAKRKEHAEQFADILRMELNKQEAAHE